MPRQQRVKSNSGYYHIMIRGNERRNIFLDDEDKMRLLETLYERKQGNRFFIHAYCFMDNHVHLMLSEGLEDVAKVMKRINVSYVFYFNKKYERVGHLFQDRFKSEVVENDGYVLALARYIHQNPVKAGIVNSVDDYKWSSYQSYINENGYFAKLLETDTILRLFSEDKSTAKKLFKKYMNEGGQEVFLDMTGQEEIMDEEEARELFNSMLGECGIKKENDIKLQVPNEIIRNFKEKTGFSIRKIAEITGLNKDKINKIIRI